MTEKYTDWYPRRVAKYRAATQHLSILEHGIYTLLLDEYYQTNQPLPANATFLQRICRAFAHEEVDALHSILQQFFTLRGDFYHNSTVDEQLNKRAKISKIRSKSAKLKGSPSTTKIHSAKAPANADTLTLTDTVIKKDITNVISKENDFILPDWVPIEPWNDYVEMRKKNKKPMTAKAMHLAVKKLDDWMKKGHDPAEILNNSTMNGYTGIFEPKENKNGKSINKPSFESEGKRLAEKYRAEAVSIRNASENLRLAETIR